MTLYHFGNCLALIYAPYHMAYKFSGISEYGTFSRCVQAGGLFLLTQLCKMLLLATFFPDTDTSNATGQYDLFLELLKATVDFADLIGMHVALSLVSGKGHAKILTAAIGWAIAEVACVRGVPLWSGARGAEFSWRHVRACLAANLALVQHAATAALLYTRARRPAPPAPLPALTLALLAATPLAPPLLAAVALTPWVALSLRAAYTLAVAGAALALYARTSM